MNGARRYPLARWVFSSQLAGSWLDESSLHGSSSSVFYRLYFSPTAHFPGPKLAALTQWYRVYYDVYLNEQFTFAREELHKKYGKLSLSPIEITS